MLNFFGTNIRCPRCGLHHRKTAVLCPHCHGLTDEQLRSIRRRHKQGVGREMELAKLAIFITALAVVVMVIYKLNT